MEQDDRRGHLQRHCLSSGIPNEQAEVLVLKFWISSRMQKMLIRLDSFFFLRKAGDTIPGSSPGSKCWDFSFLSPAEFLDNRPVYSSDVQEGFSVLLQPQIISIVHVPIYVDCGGHCVSLFLTAKHLNLLHILEICNYMNFT